MLFNFIWHNKLLRVKKQTIIADICDGGLKMTDVFAFHNAQKAMWIKHYLLNSNAKWKTLFQQLCKLEDYELDHKLSTTK